jgi:hypothetical protein
MMDDCREPKLIRIPLNLAKFLIVGFPFRIPFSIVAEKVLQKKVLKENIGVSYLIAFHLAIAKCFYLMWVKDSIKSKGSS